MQNDFSLCTTIWIACVELSWEPWQKYYIINRDVIENVTNHIPQFLESYRDRLLSDEFSRNEVQRTYEFLMLILSLMREGNEAATFFSF